MLDRRVTLRVTVGVTPYVTLGMDTGRSEALRHLRPRVQPVQPAPRLSAVS